MTSFRTPRSGAAPTARSRGVATLDDALWGRVGAILVARGRLTADELETVLAEQRRSQVPMDEILVECGVVGRQEMASLVLICQLGGEDRKRLRTRLGETASPPAPKEPATVVPVGRPFTFKLACLGVDLTMIVLATLAMAWSRSASGLAFPSTGWVVLFALLIPALYWSWRLYTYRTKLRPFADAVLIAGASALAAMVVLTIRSLGGGTGVVYGFLPLWALVAVYGVVGRFGFYLFWTVWAARRSEPAPGDAAAEPVGDESSPSPPGQRHMSVVPLRPSLEIDAVVGERRASRR